MCGICGVVDFSGRRQIDNELIQGMLAAIYHRGPDDSGIFLDGNIALGAQRLSIIDISGGHQPISNEDKSIWIVFNGEIYNFQELRYFLERKGHRFRSRSDTEVVLHLYEEYGPQCVERLNGMFALAIWDKDKKTLFLCRDRLGIKPLYYTESQGEFIFASEIKSILRHQRVSKEIDPVSLSQYLTHEYVPSPNSIFKKIKKLPPAHMLIYRNGNVGVSCYWEIGSFQGREGPRDEQECISQFSSLFKESIKRRLISDVPIGIFSSGGIDSSAIVAFVRQIQGNRLRTFSIGFNEPSFDESQYSDEVSRVFDTEHHSQVFDTKDMLGFLPDVVRMLDEPFGDASIFPTYLLAKFAKGYITVALGGDGGDELFFGYPTYQAHKIADYYRYIPQRMHRFLSRRIVSNLPVSMDNLSFDYKLKRFMYGLPYSVDIRHMVWIGSFAPEEKHRLLSRQVIEGFKDSDGLSPAVEALKVDRSCNVWDRLQYLYIKTYLQDDILFKIDRASMAHSLEARLPYLDHKLVEFICGLPIRYKLKGLKSKYLLKKSMQGILPRRIINRRKKGFGVPVAFWIKNELKELVLDVFNESDIKREGLFNFDYISNLLKQHFENKKDNRKEIWTLLMFELWYREYMC